MDYKKSGVDVAAADKWVEDLQAQLALHPSHSSQNLVSGVGDYAAVYKQNENEWIATSCDGIGTKILWTLDGLGTAKDLAQDLVAMNVNDVLCTGATPKLFLDYLACSGSAALAEGRFLKSFIRGLVEVCREHGQILAGGETAQMPDLYQGDHFDAAGFSVGFLKPANYIHPSQLKEDADGAELWGWPSNGPHSNGFTLLRKLFDAKKDAALIREHFMRPTRIYVQDFARLRADVDAKSNAASSILAAYHITGSGLLNLLRSQNQFGFELSAWPKEFPQWFKLVQERSGASLDKMLTTFNGGFGFIMASRRGTISKDLATQHKLVKLGQVTSKYAEKVFLEQLDITLS